MKSVVCKLVNINWEAFVGGWVCWLTVLVEESSAQVVADDPGVFSGVVLARLCSSFITVMISVSSVAMVGVPFSQRVHQSPIECCEHFDESAPLLLASSAWIWLVRNIGCWSVMVIQCPSGWFFSDMMCSCCIACLAQM